MLEYCDKNVLNLERIALDFVLHLLPFVWQKGLVISPPFRH